MSKHTYQNEAQIFVLSLVSSFRISVCVLLLLLFVLVNDLMNNKGHSI